MVRDEAVFAGVFVLVFLCVRGQQHLQEQNTPVGTHTYAPDEGPI